MNYIKLLRPLNLLIIAATMYLFRICLVAASPYKLFYVEPVMSNVEFLLLVLATLFIAAGGYVINDVFDVEIDAVNRQGKVIVGNSVSEASAYNLYKVLCAAAVISTVLLALLTRNFRLSMLPLIIMVILNFYAHTFKKQLFVGNFMIALSTAFTIWLIALFETSPKGEQTDMQSEVQSGIAIAAIVYGLFAFLTTFLRELVKDMEDMEGDERGGCKTIPIVLGVNGAKAVAGFISVVLLLILLAFAWFFPSMQIKLIAYFIVLGLILPLFLINILLFLAKNSKNYHFVSNLIKVFMCLGIASMLYFRSGIGPYIFVQFANFINKLF